MVQVIDDPLRGNVFGRLGASLGKGLSEQLPKEIERSRLASGLKDFEAGSQGLNPIQQYARLAAIPGMTPEHLYNLSPLLKQVSQRQAAPIQVPAGRQAQVEIPANSPGQPQTSRTGMQSNANIPQQSNISERAQVNEDYLKAQDPNTPRQFPQAGIVTQEALNAEATPIIRPTPEEIWNRGIQLSQQDPFNFPTPEAGANFVDKQVNTEIANQEAMRNKASLQRNQQQEIDSEFNAAMGAKLHKPIGGLENYGDVLGDMQVGLRNAAYEAVKDGKMTPKQAGQYYSNKGLELAKATNKLRELSGLTKFQRSTGGIVSSIKSIQKMYDELGLRREFTDMVRDNLDLTQAGASYLVNPASNNKSIQKELDNFKKYSSFDLFGESPNRFQEDEAYKKIASHLNPNDSLLSIGYALQEKGFDPDKWLSYIANDPDVPLTQVQRNEMNNSFPKLRSLGDIWLYDIGKSAFEELK